MEASMGRRLKFAGLSMGLLLFGVVCGFQLRGQGQAGAAPEAQQAAADVNANGVFKRTTNAITNGGTTDNYQVSYHGQTVAHIDTWCHFFVDGQMYNGIPVKDNITPEAGCIKGG